MGACVAAPALAEPLSFNPDRREAAPAAAPPAPATRYASAQRAGLGGGGFIEFLFGAAPAPNTNYQNAPGASGVYQVEPGAAPGNDPPGEPARPAMDPRFLPRTVDYAGAEQPGTVVINTNERMLYLVEDGHQARRYGIGVGRPGFTWAGVHHITNKREWPDWRPPDEMLRRRPDLPHFMSGGPGNPLGARAMYLGSTLYRIHGSNEPWTIGQAVSSGCIRMRNEDVIDLYGRVRVGTKVVVI
jgi:lipoprotein-anchoring transpeptidase ErfK/SrfK